MGVPKVFVSSTYLDLKETRDYVRRFIEEYGYEPVLFEKGGVFFDHNQQLDESCYKEVLNCHIFVLIIGGRYGSPAHDTGLQDTSGVEVFNSVTKREFQTALGANIPVYIFIPAKIMGEHQTYIRNNRSLNVEYAHVDNPNIYLLIDEIFALNRNNLVREYSENREITDWLKHQWAGIAFQHLTKDKEKIETKGTKINAYKMFYFRHCQNISFRKLSEITKIAAPRLRGYERLLSHNSFDPAVFRNCSTKDIERIEKALNCSMTLRVGRIDDFGTHYMDYYMTYKGLNRNAGGHKPKGRAATRHKAIVFDFEGTLTKPDDNLTIWEKIWIDLGYTKNDCAMYFMQYKQNTISHRKWCDITCSHFREKRFCETQLRKIGEQIQLVDGIDSTLNFLRSKGIKLYIASGSIKQIIKIALRREEEHFDDIKANNMIFDLKGLLERIIGTEFDFEGKARYLTQIAKDIGVTPAEIMFIGNSINDVYASRSGVDTLCVNPIYTDPTNKTHWHNCIMDMQNLSDILPYVTI